MASWSEFASAAPALAGSIRATIHQYGAGLGYLATVRPDGGPRIHPVSPSIVGGRLYCCLVGSPKRRDLERDSRYALHAYPSDESDDEAGLRGRAELITEPVRIRQIATRIKADMAREWWLYELRIEMAFMVRRSMPAGRTAEVAYQKWVDPFRQRALVKAG
jgi:Pyridoxamine 5'-phosphate oxidase